MLTPEQRLLTTCLVVATLALGVVAVLVRLLWVYGVK